MSRCFPFPPPGYERKARAGDVDLVKQDKHREKKRKKDKRDNEKREGKEKKEKDRSDEKHRDKKEKKDKHRDKKDKQKEKEKERERGDRSSISSEKKQPEHVGYINEEKLLDQRGACTFLALQIREKSIQKEKDNIKNGIADSKRPSVTLGGHNAERFVSTNHVARLSDDKCIQELAKRLKSDHCSGSEQASAAPDQRKDDGKGQLLGKAPGTGLEGGKERTKDRRHNNNEQKMDERASSRLNGTMKVQDFGGAGQTKFQEGQLFSNAPPGAGLEGKERTKNRRRDNEQKMDEHVAREQSRLNGTVKVQDFGGAGQKKLQEIAKHSVVNAKEMEWQEMLIGKEGDDKRRDKLKDQYIDKSQGRVKESRKKEERTKEKSEQKNIDQGKLKAGNKNGVLGSPQLNSLQPVNESNRTIATEGNLKKRKEYETNGFLLGDEVRANKIHKQAQGFQLPMENGMETHQISTQVTPSRPEPTNNVKVNREVKKVNGVKGGAHTSSMSPLPLPSSSTAAQAELLLAEASSSVKPPHPDSKFLSEILKIPKLDELPNLDDDHEWLIFSCNKENLKKSKGASSISQGTPEVWGESLHMESADIYALPYVIPY